MQTDNPTLLADNHLTVGSGEALGIYFNQDHGCFTVSTETGFSVYNTNPIGKRFTRDFGAGVGIVETLFKTPFVALVGGGKHPRFVNTKVILWKEDIGKPVSEIECDSEVKAVKLRKDRIVIVVDDKVYLYNLNDLTLLRKIKTCHNPKGLVAISYGDRIVIACPDVEVGKVRVEIYDSSKPDSSLTELLISAHLSELNYLTITPDGKFLATASSKGTLIRVFDTSTGEKLREFRRGTDQADINSIAFSPDMKYVCCSSSSGRGTVHIFSWEEPGAGYSFMSYVPYVNAWRSSTQFGIIPGVKSICTFLPGDQNAVVVICSNGYYYKYTFEPSFANPPAQAEFSKFLTDAHVNPN